MAHHQVIDDPPQPSVHPQEPIYVELQPPPPSGSEETVNPGLDNFPYEIIFGSIPSFETDGAVASALRKKKPAQNEESDIEKGPSGEELLEAQGATPNFESHQTEETIRRDVFYPECARVQDVAPSDVSHQTGGEWEVNLEWVTKVCTSNRANI